MPKPTDKNSKGLVQVFYIKNYKFLYLPTFFVYKNLATHKQSYLLFILTTYYKHKVDCKTRSNGEQKDRDPEVEGVIIVKCLIKKLRD